MTAGRSQKESWNCVPRLFLHMEVYMNEKNIQYTTIEQQIENLRSQNLIINHEDFAKESLILFGYSNLIKSYREPYTIFSEDKKFFRSGVSFEQIKTYVMLLWLLCLI